MISYLASQWVNLFNKCLWRINCFRFSPLLGIVENIRIQKEIYLSQECKRNSIYSQEAYNLGRKTLRSPTRKPLLYHSTESTVERDLSTQGHLCREAGFELGLIISAFLFREGGKKAQTWRNSAVLECSHKHKTLTCNSLMLLKNYFINAK